MLSIIKFLGSLRFALFLIGGLAVILVISTLTESRFGTPFAQKIFYQAGWFDVFLGLFALSIVCSTLTRLPFKTKHTSFIVTHIGILLLLAGALFGRLAGAEGQMLLYEGDKSSEILQSRYELVAHRHGGQSVRADLRERAGSFELDLDAIEKGLVLSLSEISENVRKGWRVEEGDASAPPNAAVELTLESERVGFRETFWLVEKHPEDPASADKAIGPARIVLMRKKTEAVEGRETLFVRPGPGAEEKAVDLARIPKDDIRVGDFRIRNLRYYPDARVSDENRLVSVSDKPLNPAVEFEWVDASGNKRRVAYFSLFPDFESMHNRGGKSAGPGLRLDVPGTAREIPPPALVFSTDGGRWSYVSRSSKDSVQGDVAVGEVHDTGWMDFRFEVKKLASRAVVHETFERLEEGNGELAARAVLKKDGRTLWQDWLVEAEPQSVDGLSEGLVLLVHRKSVPVPFSLRLLDFRKVDYPGTQSAMAYESDVALEDPSERTLIQKTISMNRPLDYKGYRIFQSSFVQSPGSDEEASVFTVAKNPGIAWIYGGAVILFLGVFLLFFVGPLSSFDKP